MIGRLAHTFARLELILSNVTLAMLVLVLILQVVFRYGLQTGLTWSEEVSRFAFIWFVYLSASLAAQRGAHIRVTLFVDMLKLARPYALLLADMIWIAFNIFVVVAGVLLIQRTLKYPVYSTALFLPMAWIYIIIPAAHALMILRILERQWNYWRHGVPIIVGEQALAEGQPS